MEAGPALGGGSLDGFHLAARSAQERRQGLRGTDSLAGALWITRCAAVHCIGMRYPIDVVHVTRRGQVLCVRLMRPGSIGLPRLRAYAVLELPAGWAARLGISTGAAVALGPPRQQERGEADGAPARSGY